MQGLEAAHAVGDCGAVEPSCKTDEDGGHHVVDVVRTVKRDVGHVHDLDRPRIAGRRGVDDRCFVAHVEGRLAMRLARKPERARADARVVLARRCRDDRVVEVPHKRVARALVCEDAEFRFGVLVHRVIAVEVIGRDVDDARNARFERADRFELERRHFRNHPVFGLRDGGLSD